MIIVMGSRSHSCFEDDFYYTISVDVSDEEAIEMTKKFHDEYERKKTGITSKELLWEVLERTDKPVTQVYHYYWER